MPLIRISKNYDSKLRFTIIVLLYLLINY